MDGRNVVHEQYVRITSPSSQPVDLLKILNNDDSIYEEGVSFFSTNMSIPEVPEGSNTIIQLVVLDNPIEFNLSTLSETLELPNEGEHYFLTMNDKVTSYGHNAF